jgi:hypothetical protein
MDGMPRIVDAPYAGERGMYSMRETQDSKHKITEYISKELLFDFTFLLNPHGWVGLQHATPRRLRLPERQVHQQSTDVVDSHEPDLCNGIIIRMFSGSLVTTDEPQLRGL